MDIKSILVQLDNINLREEDEEFNIAAQQQANKEKIDYVKKQEHLYSLLKQLRALVSQPQNESKVSISKNLVESFGYNIDEDAEDAEFMQFLQSAEQNFTTNSSTRVAEAGAFAGWIYKIFLTTFGMVVPAKAAWKNIETINANPRYSESQKNNLVGAEIEKLVGIFVTNSAAALVGGKFLSFIGKIISFIPGPLGIVFKAIGAALQSNLAEKALQGLVVWWTSKFGSQFGTWVVGKIFEEYLSREQIGMFIREPMSIMSGLVDEVQQGERPWETDVTQGPSNSEQGAKISPNADPEVIKIQQALVAKGAKIKVDGILGPATFAAFDQYGDQLEEAANVAESIRYLQNLLTLIENDNEVNSFNGEYAFNEEFSIEAGKKKFISKYPDLAKKLGVTITPLDPASPEAPATATAPSTGPTTAPPTGPITAPPTGPAPAAPEKTVGGAAKRPQQPSTTTAPVPQSKPSVAPTTGVGAAPFAQLDAKSRLDAMTLVKQIKLAIQDMQKVPPSVQGDAKKAIDHAHQTLQTYAPEMV